MGVYSGFKGIL